MRREQQATAETSNNSRQLPKLSDRKVAAHAAREQSVHSWGQDERLRDDRDQQSSKESCAEKDRVQGREGRRERAEL